MDNFHRNVSKAISDRRIAVKRTLNAMGNNHVLEGSIRAPVKKGTLRLTIEKQVHNSSVVIRVPVNSPSSDYVVSKHEDYYNLGINSLDSQNRSGVEIGRKFFIRGREFAVTKDKKILKKYLSV